MAELLVEVTRGRAVESVHRVTAAVARPDGTIVGRYGDIDRAVYPRSALKPFQALATLESGAFAGFGLGDEELALHCASHSGENGHLQRVASWLSRLALDESALECGPQTPLWALQNAHRAHQAPPPRALANNCSGKHAGFLTAACHAGEDTAGYIALDHPVQQRVRRLISALAGIDVEAHCAASDNCRAPIYAFPLSAFAVALARLARPEGLSSARAEGAARVIAAMRAHPWLVAGSGRPDTRLMEDPGLDGIAKCGAEGCYALALPEAGLGVALKVDDGAGRAAPVAAIALLRELGLMNDAAAARLGDVARPVIRNWSGEIVGEIRIAGTA